MMSTITELRDRARKHIEDGAVTSQYPLDQDQAVSILNEALATEIVCVLRYRHHSFMATGIHSSSVAAEFLSHSNEEQEHADRIAERIRQLGGKPDFNPATLLERSHAEYREGVTLADMIRENLIAERIAVESYREIITFFGQDDPTSRRLIEEILAKEEEHADELADLLFTVAPEKEQAAGKVDAKAAAVAKKS